jgi:hypothetical protein
LLWKHKKKKRKVLRSKYKTPSRTWRCALDYQRQALAACTARRLLEEPATLDRTFVSISIYVSLALFFYFLLAVALPSGNETAAR